MTQKSGQGDTIFSKIISREVPAAIVFENENVLAFKDVYPKAPIHILVIPKKCIPNMNAVCSDDQELLGEMLVVATEIAKKEGLKESGYRLVINTGPDAGQSVAHIHIHILGGREMEWPPG